MASLIIPVILLLLLGLWGVVENGRKFRTEFRKRGKGWEAVCAAMEKGEGLLVVDTIWGPQRGLGHPTIWWIAGEVDGDELPAKIESVALLVPCPRKLKSIEALRGRFGAKKVLLHSWAVGAEVMQAGSAKP